VSDSLSIASSKLVDILGYAFIAATVGIILRAIQERVGPEQTPAVALSRYLESFSSLIALARQEGMRVVVIKMPMPPEFHKPLPGEAAFDDAITRLPATPDTRFDDLSLAISEPRFYFDTDHLNRAGLTEFFADHLKPILVSAKGG
jgi:Family of unknown function (DUF6159)